MKGRCRRELTLENRLYPSIEFRRLETRPQQRDAGVCRRARQSIRQVLTLGDNHHRQRERKERRKDFVAVARFERREIGNLRLAENLQTLCDESLDIACEGKPGTRQIGAGYLAIQAAAVAEVLELQRFSAALEELPHGERARHARKAPAASRSDALALRARIPARLRTPDFRARPNLRTCALSLVIAAVRARP